VQGRKLILLLIDQVAGQPGTFDFDKARILFGVVCVCLCTLGGKGQNLGYFSILFWRNFIRN